MLFGNNPANELKDTMWQFLMDNGQKADIPALKDAVYSLIKATTQKDGGQRGHKNNIDFQELDMIFWDIIIQATALVLSGELENEGEKNEIN
jgi:hypothetical protein